MKLLKVVVVSVEEEEEELLDIFSFKEFKTTKISEVGVKSENRKSFGSRNEIKQNWTLKERELENNEKKKEERIWISYSKDSTTKGSISF